MFHYLYNVTPSQFSLCYVVFAYVTFSSYLYSKGHAKLENFDLIYCFNGGYARIKLLSRGEGSNKDRS